MTWTHKHGIKHTLIEPGSPTQNAYIESFNGTFRDECLNENWFESLVCCYTKYAKSPYLFVKLLI